MPYSFAPWLDQVASSVFWWCATALIVIDVAAMAVVLQTRSRAIVDRWTGRVLAANLLLLGAGLGVPAAAFAAKLVTDALRPAFVESVAVPSKAVPAPAPASQAFSAD